MSRREEYEKQTEELLEPIVAEQGFELVDVEYVKEAGNWYLRAYIDKPGGITVDDCEVVSRRFSDILDEKDYIEDSYIFERNCLQEDRRRISGRIPGQNRTGIGGRDTSSGIEQTIKAGL